MSVNVGGVARSTGSAPAAPPRRSSTKYPAPRQQRRQQDPSGISSLGGTGVQLSMNDLNRITNPSLPQSPSSRAPAPPSASVSRDAHRALHDVAAKHDALMIVEQKAPNVWRLPNEDSNVNRIINSDMRHEALRTLPLAFPPVRFRRGETVDEYIESVTKPWDDVRKHSATSFVARRMSASGGRTLVEDIALSAQAQKNEALRARHEHLVSAMWRQTHAAKADIIVAEETSSSLLRPLLERGTQRAIEVEQQMVAAMAESCREGISATPRGLVVPYQYYANLVHAIHGAMDETFMSFFQLAQDEQTRQTRADEDAASSSLRHLIKGSAAVKHVEVELPAPGHPSRHSLVTVKTAVNVSVLWRMLEQVKSIVPGMETALELFHELLPLIYVDFAQVRPLLPNVSCLGEQIKQLCSIPLISVELQRTAANEEQFRHDADFLRMAMENWSFNIWRNYNSIERRRAKHLDSLNQLFERYERRRAVGAVFNEWRLHVMQEKTNIAMQAMKSKYDAFIATARHAAAESIPMSTNRAVAANQARFIAQRLATAAVHEKPSSRPLVVAQRPVSPSSTSKQLKQPTKPLSTGGTLSPAATSPVSRGRAVVSFSPVRQGPSDKALVDSTQGEDDGDTQGSGDGPTRRHFFDEVIAKLQSVEDVSGHLREFIAMQRKAIDKLEADRRKLTDSLEQSRGDAIQLLEEKLKLNNIIQDRDLKIRDQLKQIIRLKAKVRLHRHKHWRSASMRVLSDTLGLSNADVEKADQARALTESSNTGDPHQTTAPNPIRALTLQNGDDEDGGDASETERTDPEFSTKQEGPTDQERIFGRIAPIVLDAPTQLPDALVILKDWGNNCLEDLQALDGVGGGSSLSSRFSSLSNELRDGIIISRLLFYLALPRYRSAPQKNEELEDVSPDFNINRQRLLRLKGVQLHSPFPTYDDCFGDLMRFPAVKRMNILLNFASDLISGTLRLSAEQIDAIQTLQSVSDRFAEQDAEQQQRHVDGDGDGNHQGANNSSFSQNTSGLGQKKRSANRILLDFADGVPAKGRKGSTAFSEGVSFPSSSEFLPQYIDPLLLCEGSRSAAVTLLAMLYIRFAHAFNHKANETSAKESELMKALMRDQTSSAATGTQQHRAASPSTRRLEDMLGTIEEEEKSPWQIFLDRCKPFFTTSAHPFVLEGNFWSASLCESAEMLQVFAAVTCALRRSLDVHRWHVTMMCLAPMISSFGMTRGCFSGVLASTNMYLYQRSCETTDVCFNAEVVFQLAVQRKEWKGGNATAKSTSLSTTPQATSLAASFLDSGDNQTRAGMQESLIQLSGSPVPGTDPGGFDEGFAKSAYCTDLARTLESFTADLAKVFLSRSSVSATLLVPSMTLTAWRMLWLDVGYCPEKISVETLTCLFADACRPPLRGSPGMPDPIDDSASSDPRGYSIGFGGTAGGGGIINALQEMTFDEFCEGCLRIAHHRYAPVAIVSGGGGGAPASPGPSVLADGAADTTRPKFDGGSSVNAPLPLPAFHSLSPTASRGASASPPKRKVLTSLRDAFVRLITEAILPLNPMHAPPSAMLQLKQGVLVQDLLRRKNGEMLSIFQAYAKVYLGIAGLEKEDVLRMVKDAGLATAELSYQVVADLFVECSLKRTQADHVLMNTMDPNQADSGVPASRHGSIFAGHGNSIVGGGSFFGAPGAGGPRMASAVPRHQMSLMQQATMDRQMLDFPSFVDFLCVLMLYKLPNPFVPMHARLENFLERSLIAPLRFRVEQVARAKARNKDARGAKEGTSSAQQSVQPQPLVPPKGS